jgi:hypothetical protein
MPVTGREMAGGSDYLNLFLLFTKFDPCQFADENHQTPWNKNPNVFFNTQF